jgi:hypothetical protein
MERSQPHGCGAVLIFPVAGPVWSVKKRFSRPIPSQAPMMIRVLPRLSAMLLPYFNLARHGGIFQK